MDPSVQCPETNSESIEFSTESSHSINLSDVATENQESMANSDSFPTNTSLGDIDPQEVERLFVGDFVPVRPGRFMAGRFIRRTRFIRNTQPSNDSIVARLIAPLGNTQPMRNTTDDDGMADDDGIWRYFVPVPVRPGRFMAGRFNPSNDSIVARRIARFLDSPLGNTRPMRNTTDDDGMADDDGIWRYVNFQRGDGDDGSQASTVMNSPDSAALSVTSGEPDWQALDTSD